MIVPTSTPTLRPITSSAIEAAGYQPMGHGLGLIILRFHSGGTYAYLRPSWMYGLLLAGRSTGCAYHKLVRLSGPQAVRIQ